MVGREPRVKAERPFGEAPAVAQVRARWDDVCRFGTQVRRQERKTASHGGGGCGIWLEECAAFIEIGDL